jgi:hypothetical protein
MRHGGNPICRFWVSGSILFFILLLSPNFSRAASPAADAKLADIIGGLVTARPWGFKGSRSRNLLIEKFLSLLKSGGLHN